MSECSGPFFQEYLKFQHLLVDYYTQYGSISSLNDLVRTNIVFAHGIFILHLKCEHKHVQNHSKSWFDSRAQGLQNSTLYVGDNVQNQAIYKSQI